MILTACLLLFFATAHAGVIDPDCDAGKAAREAAKDTVGLDDRDGTLDRDDN